MSTNKSVIVYGPCACGKTQNAARIAKALGLPSIDDECYGANLKRIPAIATLAITGVESAWIHSEECKLRVLSYDQVMLIVEGYEAACHAVAKEQK